MMFCKLPNQLFSWAWTSRFLRSRRSREDDFERTPGGVLVRRTEEIDDTPALAHFAKMTPEGTEFAWLWLFEDPRQARQLRLLQEFHGRVEAADSALIGDTLPMAPPGEPDLCYLQTVPVDWLAQNQTPDIHEVWLGFDFKRYVGDRRLGFCAQILPFDEFCEIATR